MNQPTKIIVKNHEGTPVCEKGEILGTHSFNEDGTIKDWVSLVHPCPSIANTEPGKTVMAELKWQMYDDNDGYEEWTYSNCPERDRANGYITRQIWIPIVEQKKGEGKFGEWVSVKDRLPERKVWVIGYKEGQSKDDWTHPIDQRIMYYTGPGEWSGWMEDTGYTFTPTHWMPLPEKPITEKP